MADLPTGAEWARQWLAASPFVKLVGMRLVRLERDWVELVMPFRDDIVTLGDVVHGGALSTLVDNAATAAVWSGIDVPDNPRGATIGMTVNFLAGARGRDVTASARVIQRGRSISVCDVEVTDTDGRLVVKALVTYKLG